MNEQPKKQTPNRNDTKTLLSTLKWTTTIGAVSLTLAGWGLLSQAEVLSGAKTDQNPSTFLTAADTSGALANTGQDSAALEAVTLRATATQNPTRAVPTAALPTATATATAPTTATAAPAATATPAPTAAPAKMFSLDVVQWVQNSNGDPIAIVRDNSGVQWYVWGPDVERIESGLDPQYQPQAVNATGRSRGS